MSFPPRPPMGMPGMMTQGYGFPIGMMSMGLNMMGPPTMMRPLIPTTTQQSTKQTKKALIPQDIPKDDKKEEKPPVTTVFVGNISERAPDMMIKQMLQRCGNVLSWKRVQGANGKLQAFGFCEYEQPEATLRCIRLLNEWQIGEKKLVVKVDAKTNVLLEEYISKRNKKDGDKASSSKSEEEKDKDKDSEGKKEGGEEKEDLDEFTKREDRVARAGLEAIMREYSAELAKAPNGNSRKEEKESKSSQKKKEDKEIKDQGFDDMDLEDDKREIINREIKSFRDLHKDEDEQENDRQREKARMEEKRRRDREKERERERERERLREREREREREKSFERERTRSRSRSRSSSRGRSRRRERSRSRERSRDRSRERRKERELEAEEEEYERRKLEKKLREKEAAYQERLKQWELRERKRAREYEKEATREEDRKAEEVREARRLKEFLEDYDDLRDDPKFYKGSELARRLKEREKEKEVDMRDRQREKEELEEIRRKLLEEGHPDIEGELARMEFEREEHLKPRLQLPPEKSPSPPPPAMPEQPEPRSNGEEGMPEMRPLQPLVRSAPSTASTATPGSEDDSRMSLPGHMSEDSSQTFTPAPIKEEQATKFGFSGLKLGSNSPADGSSKRKKITVGDVFNNDEDETSTKRRKLMPLDYDDDKSAEKKPSTAEEKRQKIKHLIESIPTAKNELFSYPLDWNIVDQSLMDKRIKPWVNKKIVEYIGEEEPQLTEFICQKVIARSTPQRIQDDVAMILDEEAEVFVVKMWRLLVYETEAKKLGLVK